jgi:hypothetical protein
MNTRQIIATTLGSNDPGRIREILQGYFHEIENVLPDILGTLHDDIIPDSVSQLAGELYAVTIKALFGVNLYATRLLQSISADSHGISMQQLKRIYRERQVTQLCQNLCYFSSSNDYLSDLVSRTLPNVRKLYDLSHAITRARKNPGDDRTQIGINQLTGFVVSFSILYRELHDKTELTDVEVESLQYAHSKISQLLQPPISSGDPCVTALNGLKDDIRSVISRNTNVECSFDAPVSEYSSHSIYSADSEGSDEDVEVMSPAWIRLSRASSSLDGTSFGGMALLLARRRSDSDSSFIARYYYAQLICPCLNRCFRVLVALVLLICMFVMRIRLEGVAFGLAHMLFVAFSLTSLVILDNIDHYFDLDTGSWFALMIRRSLYPPRFRHDACVIFNNTFPFINLGSLLNSIVVMPFSILRTIVIDFISISTIVILQLDVLFNFIASTAEFIGELVWENTVMRIRSLLKHTSTLSHRQTANLTAIRESLSFIGFTAQANCHIMINCMIRSLEVIVRPFLLAFGIFAPRTASSVVSSIESHMFVDDILRQPGPNESLSSEERLTHWLPMF